MAHRLTRQQGSGHTSTASDYKEESLPPRGLRTHKNQPTGLTHEHQPAIHLSIRSRDGDGVEERREERAVETVHNRQTQHTELARIHTCCGRHTYSANLPFLSFETDGTNTQHTNFSYILSARLSRSRETEQEKCSNSGTFFNISFLSHTKVASNSGEHMKGHWGSFGLSLGLSSVVFFLLTVWLWFLLFARSLFGHSLIPTL